MAKAMVEAKVVHLEQESAWPSARVWVRPKAGESADLSARALVSPMGRTSESSWGIATEEAMETLSEYSRGAPWAVTKVIWSESKSDHSLARSLAPKWAATLVLASAELSDPGLALASELKSGLRMAIATA